MSIPSIRSAAYDGKLATLFQIALSNTALIIITLGFFRFWAKARTRRYVWSRVSFLGDRVHYTGLGIEKFIGFLIALLVLVPAALIYQYAYLGFSEPSHQVWIEQIFAFGFFYLYQFAVFRSRRYRLSRTSWRHIHFNQKDGAWRYAFYAMIWYTLAGLSLGLLYSTARVRLQAYRTRSSFFGDQPFEFTGRARVLLGRWIVALLLAIPSLGISLIYYFAAEFRYFAASTTLGGIRFTNSIKAGRLLGITMVAGLLQIVCWGVVLAVAGAIILPGLMVATEAAADDHVMLTLGFFTVFDENFWQLVVTFLFGILASGIIRLVFLTQPLLRLAVVTTHIVGDDAAIESIGQAPSVGLSGGEGFADAFDIGAV